MNMNQIIKKTALSSDQDLALEQDNWINEF